MADAKQMVTRYETGTVETAAIAAFRVVTVGAAVDGLKTCTASLIPIGVAQEAGAVGDRISYSCGHGDVLKVVASAALTRLSSSKPQRVIADAAGKVASVPSTAGTYYQVGWTHNSTPDAAADGDTIGIIFDPQVLVVTADGTVNGFIPIPASAAQGDVVYRNATTWARLAAGTDEQVLVTQGAAANPKWLHGLTTDYPASQAQGDVFIRGASGLERLGAGTAGKSLVTGGASANPAWKSKPFVACVPVTTATGLTAANVAGILVPAGYTLRVDVVSVFARTVTAAITVDVKEADTSILSAAITPVADTVTAGTVSDASVAAGAELNITLTTDGSGAATNLVVNIVGELIPA